jgi:hypothetical protein
MLNKDFYNDKLDEISEALDASENWFNSEEFEQEFNRGWWEGFAVGFVAPFATCGALFLIWQFIHSASH